ncbi:unnamed protein product [Durusdinium trenchii]|uniref:Fe2OG dioxygenase domain-containing protein n=1 Tax=Durusdinium trenchii TaxID=1381693 RepID=A0ABP0H7K1_9DINO
MARSRSPSRPSARSAQPSVAFVTLASAEYGPGALVLTAGLRRRLPLDVEVIAFSEAELSLVPGVTLRALSELPDVPVPAGVGEPLMANFSFCWRKLGLWALTEYDIIVYMDSDILILNEVESLLEFVPSRGMLAAVPACECWRSESCNYTAQEAGGGDFYFNAGVLVFRPSASIFSEMIAWLKDHHQHGAVSEVLPPMPFAEQDFLNQFFPEEGAQVHEELPLFLVRDYISREVEGSLVSLIYGDFLKDRWIQLRNRALLCLGGVPHPEGAICEDLPVEIAELGRGLVDAGGMSSVPDQCLINQYLPGQGIDAHSDGPRFESEVAILTLEGPALMYFGLVEKKIYPSLPPRLELLLEPRSLLVLKREAYELYVHRIDHVTVDVTQTGHSFRVTKGFWSCLFAREPGSCAFVGGAFACLGSFAGGLVKKIPRAPRRTSLTLRRLKHVQLRSEEVKDEVARSAKMEQWRWWNSQISEID